MKIKPDLSDNLGCWLNYLEKIHPSQIELGLERVESVKNKAKINPSFPIITVAGTNGKGSICRYLESILCQANLKVACYTSPHIHRFNERICINKEEVTDKDIVKSIHFIESVRGDTSITFFEITTLAAMHLFVKNKVDVCIMEVGLGGRLDAVNIFDPVVSIISSISFDHQDYLGNSLEEIGFEKAGILRPNTPGIINFKNIPKSILNHAKKIGTMVSCLGEDYGLDIDNKVSTYKSNMVEIDLNELLANTSQVKVQNMAGTIRCVEMLRNFFPISDADITKGIQRTILSARAEILSRNPCLIIDVAHNFAAAENLLKILKENRNKGILKAVFSILQDKEYEKIIELFDGVDQWHIAELKNTRALKIDQLESSIKRIHPNSIIKTYQNIEQAYQSALENCKENDNIIVFGSFYTIDESRAIH